MNSDFKLILVGIKIQLLDNTENHFKLTVKKFKRFKEKPKNITLNILKTLVLLLKVTLKFYMKLNTLSTIYNSLTLLLNTFYYIYKQ